MNAYLPFALFNEFQRRADQPVSRSAVSRERQAYAAPVDVVEIDGAYQLSMDVPGIDKSTLDISADAGVLTLRGERKIDHGEARTALRERWNGAFQRRFTLPESADIDAITASLDNGVLTLSIPKVEQSQPRKITVQ